MENGCESGICKCHLYLPQIVDLLRVVRWVLHYILNLKNNKKIYVYQTNLELEFYQNKVFSFEVVDENTLSNKQLIH